MNTKVLGDNDTEDAACFGRRNARKKTHCREDRSSPRHEVAFEVDQARFFEQYFSSSDSRMKIIFKFSISIAVILMCCSGCSKKNTKPDDTVTITFWHSFVSSTIPALNQLLKRFEDEYPNIKIQAQYVPTGDGLIQKLVAAIESSTAPDISWIHSDFLDKLVQAGAIYRMEEFIKGPQGITDEELTDIFPPLLRAATWRDTLYAMPIEATSLALLYNKTLFRKAGLDPNHPPQNWHELRDYAKRLTVDKDGDGKIDQYGFFVPVFPASGPLNIWMNLQWDTFLWQAGGREITDDQSRVLFNSDAGVQALTIWKNIYDDIRFKSFTLSHDLGFASGSVTMIMDGPWDLPRFREINNFEWAVAPLPAGPVRRATYIAGEHLAIFRQTEHPREAWTFVKWVIQPTVQAMFSMQSGYLPIRRSVLSIKGYQDFLSIDPAMKAFVEQMSVGQGRLPIDYHHVEINRFIAEAIEKATLGNMDPKTVLDEATAKSNRLLQSVHRN